MGSCLCKEDESDRQSRQFPCDTFLRNDFRDYIDSVSPGSSQRKFPSASTVDKLILETLSVVGSLVENDQVPTQSMLKLHAIADQEEGWLQVVTSMINVIPAYDPIGPSLITILLDDCPLPTKESVLRLTTILKLSGDGISAHNETQQRNISIVLGCLAEKLAGPSSVTILTSGTLNYLFYNLKANNNPCVVLYSLIALEKFAQTTENKITIKKRLLAETENILLKLEKLANMENHVQRQIGFCAQWCLDNLFLIDGRKFAYELVDTSKINCMLNTQDVSEYLKISPDGLEARCDAYSFESVRCTFQVDEGIWYYEVLLITPGVMQIGWATKDSRFLNHEGCGIGDDEYSLAYDGCRRLIWHNARSEPENRPGWSSGDILGCLLDLTKPEMVFYLNGELIRSCTHVFETVRSGFFAAASFMSFQQCRFNFGDKPFAYPPDREFKKFNDVATMKPEDKVVLPRHLRLELLKKVSVLENSCTLCFDKEATIRLIPCDHCGFCSGCVKQLKECPMCRGPIIGLSEQNT